jgi:hypothetical protein
MDNRKFQAVSENVAGDFYVEDGCCTFCTVPHSEAPTLFGGLDQNQQRTHDQCFVIKQPENGQELQQMLNAMAAQELICIRYCGHDQSIMHRIYELGEGNLVDFPA